MDTITISKKEYKALVFVKGLTLNKKLEKKKSSWDEAFGIMKKSFGKTSSVSAVKKMRNAWRA